MIRRTFSRSLLHRTSSCRSINEGGFGKDVSQGTARTCDSITNHEDTSESFFMDPSFHCLDATSAVDDDDDDVSTLAAEETELLDETTRSLETRSHKYMLDVSENNSVAGSAAARMPRATRAWSSMRGFGRRSNNDNNSQRSARQLPKRQGTFDTSVTAESSQTFAWEEERQDLLDKIEALECKLKGKEAVLHNMMMTAASKGTTIAAALTNGENQQLEALVAKDQELVLWHAKVREQAMLIEQLESQLQSQQSQSQYEQELKIQEQAEAIFLEWQEREQDPSLLEQIQEQAELIARLEADKEFQRQQQQRERKELAELIRQLQDQKAVTSVGVSSADDTLEVTSCTERTAADNNRVSDSNKEVDTLKASNDSLQEENRKLQEELARYEQEKEDYKSQVESLFAVVEKLENDKEEEVHLLNIVMRELEAVKGAADQLL